MIEFDARIVLWITQEHDSRHLSEALYRGPSELQFENFVS